MRLGKKGVFVSRPGHHLHLSSGLFCYLTGHSIKTVQLEAFVEGKNLYRALLRFIYLRKFLMTKCSNLMRVWVRSKIIAMTLALQHDFSEQCWLVWFHSNRVVRRTLKGNGHWGNFSILTCSTLGPLLVRKRQREGQSETENQREGD